MRLLLLSVPVRVRCDRGAQARSSKSSRVSRTAVTLRAHQLDGIELTNMAQA